MAIEYIQKDYPDFDIPPYKGTSYESWIPDTLDLAERADLAINGLTGPTDPEADYEAYWQVNFFRNPPIMWHDIDDVQPKFMEALPLLRIITATLTFPVKKVASALVGLFCSLVESPKSGNPI